MPTPTPRGNDASRPIGQTRPDPVPTPTPTPRDGDASRRNAQTRQDPAPTPTPDRRDSEPANISPTIAPAPGSSIVSSAADTSEPAVDLDLLLLTSADVPSPLVYSGGGYRTLDEVVVNYTDPADTRARFTSWGWQENVTQAFAMPAGVAADAQQVHGIYLSIHAFVSPDDARAALDYSLADQATSTGVYEVAAPSIGHHARALFGTMSYGNEITLLVQQDQVLVRLSASQWSGDPTPFATDLMERILSRHADQQGDLARMSGMESVRAQTGMTQAMPASSIGTWEGIGYQINPDVSWPVIVTLSAGSRGDVVGTTAYPTYPCGGDLILESVDAGTITLHERLTYGEALCADNGTVTLGLGSGGDHLTFAWVGVSSTGTESSASGVIYRTE